ncbi:MAG: hypothetical protein ACREDF_04515, partial [Thermoplasmata archaeon]
PDDDEEEDDKGEEYVVTRTHRVPLARGREEAEQGRSRRHRQAEEEEPEERPEPPTRAVQTRTQAEERAIQKFVERALRNYDHSKL